VEFRVLGPLEVVDDGRIVPLDRRRLRALLAFLLLHANELVSSDRLIDEVWGPDPPKTAGASLQNYVSRLRKAIGTQAIISQPPGYVLRVDPERFDLARFERLTADARGAGPRERAEKLRAALALWRGPALDDLAFEPFARDEVGRLEEARLAALEDCIDAELELGRDGELVGELEQLVEQHPLRERFRAQLMRALYRAGRQADALAAFKSARDVLVEELGLEPGEELRKLQQAILRQDPSLGRPGESAVERAPDRRTVTVLFCDLVGSSELAARLDPEAYRALLSRYFDIVREPIERHGGTLEKFIGDAVMAVFGVPHLHEDDALRAVRAAMEAQSALRNAEIAARIGVSTGEVHVLSAPGEPLHVSGPPASIASQLEGRAPAGAVLVSQETYALVRDALRAEPFEDAWLVEDIVPGAPAYARRLDAPLVGRAEQLERLHAAYVDARDSGRCRVVTVVGEAGIGKTRLMRELLLPLRDEARVLVGRCVSYGEGATYLPIAEMVRQAVRDTSLEGITALLAGGADADQVARRVAELIGITETPAAPGEAFWAVRRFVETIAHERPVVLVLDDIHWAEPTLLDLVEYLGEWTEGRVLVLCAARRELLESRPVWGGPTSTGFLVELAPLEAEEVEQLLLGLAEKPVDPDVERRIVEHAGGNPLFAEQLLALATEARDLALAETPPTVEALLASRLDRLRPRELAVLRRASVVGRRFTRAELADLTPPEEAARTEHHLAELTERALVHPRQHVFAFHHVLVRDVAYRGIPKAERAELHELAARGLDRRDGADEIVGFHFEQAYRCLTEIGRRGEHASELAMAGGERLGRAGIRAWKRADAPAAINLFSRALELSPEEHELACELGVALFVTGKVEQAKSVFADVAEAPDKRIAARARFELANVRALSEPDRAAELVDAAVAGIPVFEGNGDDRALGRAWLAVGNVRGGFLCEYAAMEEASARAVEHYDRAGWSPSASLQNLGAALFFGPKHVNEATAQLEQLLERFARDAASEANVLVWLGGLEAMRGSFDDARARVALAKDQYLRLGLTAATPECARVLGFIEQLAAQLVSAEEQFRFSCALLQEHGQTQVLATRAGELAHVLYGLGRYEEAETWTRIAEDAVGEDDLDAALAWKPVDAMLKARAGDVVEGEMQLRELLSITPSEAVYRTAEQLLGLAEVLRLADRDDEAREAASKAIELYTRKGNIVAAEATRPLVLETASQK
jgi:DNA-binding SARP family transcriptional activator/tetratricopeptide (TPR) repeat protein